MPRAGVYLSFAAFFGGFFLPLGVYLPFWPLWLESRGLAPDEIGLVLGLATWMRIATTPAVARWADRKAAERRALSYLCLLSFLVAAAFVTASGFWQILLVHLLWTLVHNPIMPLADSLALTAAREKGLNYGRARLWGSLAFILASLVAGWAVARSGGAIVLPLLLGGLALTSLAAVCLPDLGSGARSAAVPSLRLFARRDFAVFILATGFLQATHAVYYGFSALAWQSAGIAGQTIGWLWALGVVAEVALFAYGARLLARLGAVGLLVAAGCGGLLRWTLLATSDSLFLLVPAQLLHALTFGAAHLGAMHYLSDRAPPGLAATAQALYAALAGSLFMGGMMLAAGALYGSFGSRAYFAMTAASLAGTLLSIALLRLARHKGEP